MRKLDAMARDKLSLSQQKMRSSFGRLNTLFKRIFLSLILKWCLIGYNRRLLSGLIKSEDINLSFSIIIPSRFGSKEASWQTLLDIAGKPMIQWVYERSMQSEAENVIIATDDQRIANACP